MARQAALAAEADRRPVQARSLQLEIFVVGRPGIARNIRTMCPVILSVTNAMFVEASLPEWPRIPRFYPHRVGETALDALNAALQRLLPGRRNEQVKVVGHDDKRMECIPFFVTVMKQNLAQKYSAAVRLQEPSPVRGDDRDKERLKWLSHRKKIRAATAHQEVTKVRSGGDRPKRLNPHPSCISRSTRQKCRACLVTLPIPPLPPSPVSPPAPSAGPDGQSSLSFPSI